MHCSTSTWFQFTALLAGGPRHPAVRGPAADRRGALPLAGRRRHRPHPGARRAAAVRWQSPAAARLFGLSDAEVVGRAFRDLIHPDDVADAQAVIDAVLAGEHADGPPALVNARLRDGARLWRDTESTISDQRAVPEVAALVVHVRDVGERRHLERALHQLSYTDQLTGLANRRALMRDLLACRRRAGQQGTLLVIDLHGLAEINDSRGRETGDAVLIEVGRRIRSAARRRGRGGPAGRRRVRGAHRGRRGAGLRAGHPDRHGAGRAATSCPARSSSCTPASAWPSWPAATTPTRCCATPTWPAAAPGSSAATASSGTTRTSRSQLHRRMDLEQQLLGAADRGELDLVFQPVVGLRDEQPVGVEALLRWRHPQLGTILPAELLPIARAVGIAAELDEWVLDAACRHLAAWSTGDNDFWLSVNVAPRELLTARFPDRVAATLRRYGLRAGAAGRRGRRDLDRRGRAGDRGVPGRAAQARRAGGAGRLRRRPGVAVAPAPAAGRHAQAGRGPWSTRRRSGGRQRPGGDRRGGQPGPPAGPGDRRQGPGDARSRSSGPRGPAASTARASRWPARPRPSASRPTWTATAPREPADRRSAISSGAGAVLPRGVRWAGAGLDVADRLAVDRGEQLAGGVRAVLRDVPAERGQRRVHQAAQRRVVPGHDGQVAGHRAGPSPGPPPGPATAITSLS